MRVGTVFFFFLQCCHLKIKTVFFGIQKILHTPIHCRSRSSMNVCMPLIRQNVLGLLYTVCEIKNTLKKNTCMVGYIGTKKNNIHLKVTQYTCRYIFCYLVTDNYASMNKIHTNKISSTVFTSYSKTHSL